MSAGMEGSQNPHSPSACSFTLAAMQLISDRISSGSPSKSRESTSMVLPECLILYYTYPCQPREWGHVPLETHPLRGADGLHWPQCRDCQNILLLGSGNDMKEPPQIEKHPDVDNVVCALQQCLIDSFELFEQQLKCGGDLSGFINTPPFSPKDAVGNRTHIEHYHLRPCKPVCYLVGLVRFSDTIYILDVFKHPQ